MSFGFSVGDFFTVGGVIVKAIDALRGARSEHQELIRELESLDRVLIQLEKLTGREDYSKAVDQIKSFALTCRLPLEIFLVKIEKYEKSLGVGNSVGKIKDVGRKVQYAFRAKEEANTLRNHLAIHTDMIHVLLIKYRLDLHAAASEERSRNQEELRDRIDTSTRELQGVRSNMAAQAIAIQENKSVISSLFKTIRREIAAPLKSVDHTMERICVSMHQIYAILLEMKTDVGIDTRFIFFQAPLRVEDALGRVLPFASECSVSALYAEINARFRQGPGKIEVSLGNFEIFDARDTDQLISRSGRKALLPGMFVSMAIILEKDFTEIDKCPMPHCASKTFVNAVGGGRTCSGCQVWFDGPRNSIEYSDENILKHIKDQEAQINEMSKITNLSIGGNSDVVTDETMTKPVVENESEKVNIPLVNLTLHNDIKTFWTELRSAKQSLHDATEFLETENLAQQLFNKHSELEDDIKETSDKLEHLVYEEPFEQDELKSMTLLVDASLSKASKAKEEAERQEVQRQKQAIEDEERRQEEERRKQEETWQKEQEKQRQQQNEYKESRSNSSSSRTIEKKRAKTLNHESTFIMDNDDNERAKGSKLTKTHAMAVSYPQKRMM